MRGALALAALLGAGCSAIYDGRNLHGRHADDPCHQRAVTPRLFAFSSAQSVSIDTNISAVGAADFDGDHKTDVALLVAGSIRILGNSAGLLTPSGQIPFTDAAYSLFAGDLDGDHRPDLVTVDTAKNAIAIFWGHGDGTFDAPPQLVPTLGNPGDLTVIDLDGDGRLDLVVTTADGAPAAIHLGQPGRAFAPLMQTGAGGLAGALAAADFDGDGALDLVTADHGDARIVHNEGSLRFPLAVDHPFAGGFSAGDVLATDLDGDGRPEIVVTDTNASDGAAILHNDGAGHFPGPDTFVPVQLAGVVVAACDFDGDGAVDLVLGARNGGPRVLRNTGGLSFSAYPLVTDDFTTDLAPGDFDGDGLPDVVMVRNSDVVVFLNRP